MMALLLIQPLARLTLTAIRYAGFRRISITALLITISIIIGITGLSGLLIMLVATGIGLLPPLFGTRRMNALGIILLPIACSMSGIGFSIAHWMKLV
jgi:putative membrane protein